MKYKELFLLNHVYVVHPNRRTPVKLCPRDEVAHPTKLLDIVLRTSRTWREIRLYATNMCYIRGEYDKRYYNDVVASHVYVVADGASMPMFSDAQNVDHDDEDMMFDFLQLYGDVQFAITSPVIKLETEANRHDVYYSVPVDVNNVAVYLEHGNVVEVRSLINERCYTVCNGQTLFLAMVRMNRWVPKIALRAWNRWRLSEPALPISMSSVWYNLHITHPVPMIGDFPFYYATMYPSVPRSFLQSFNENDTSPLSQYVEDINVDEEVCLYASPAASMFPYFDKKVFDFYNTSFNTPFEKEPDDTQLIDIEGMFIAVLRSRRAWAWWKANGLAYMKNALDANKNSQGFFMYCFQVLFHLYDRPYHGIQYSHSRVRSMWMKILEAFNLRPTDVRLFISILVVRKMMYKKFNINRWHPIFPMAFLIDIMWYYNDSLNWFDNQRSRIYTTHMYNPADVMSLFSPYMSVKDEDNNEYSLDCSMYNLLKMDDVGSRFVRCVLDRRVAGKLSCISHMFGLGVREPVVDIPASDAYTVGTVFMDYLKNNRNILA